MTDQGNLFTTTNHDGVAVYDVTNHHSGDLRLNPTVPEAAKARLSKQQQAILARLRVGPATNLELIQIAQRFSARIHELRTAGYRIERTRDDEEAGIYLYALIEGEVA